MATYDNMFTGSGQQDAESLKNHSLCVQKHYPSPSPSIFSACNVSSHPGFCAFSMQIMLCPPFLRFLHCYKCTCISLYFLSLIFPCFPHDAIPLNLLTFIGILCNLILTKKKKKNKTFNESLMPWQTTNSIILALIFVQLVHASLRGQLFCLFGWVLVNLLEPAVIANSSLWHSRYGIISTGLVNSAT